MQIKFSEDVVPLSDLKINPGKIVNQVKEKQRPVLLTSRGRGVAVVQELSQFEEREEEIEFLRAVTKGLLDIKEGREKTIDEARKALGLE
jgi:prevent-host-death family protein